MTRARVTALAVTSLALTLPFTAACSWAEEKTDTDTAAVIAALGDPYEYKFDLPEHRHGYWVVPKNYLSEMDPQHAPNHLPDNGALLDTFATPGEKEPVAMVIYAQRPLKHVSISVSDLAGKVGVIPAENVSIYTVLRGPRPRLRRTPMDMVMVDKYLLIAKPFDLQEHQFREILLDIKVPLHTAAGIYKGTVTIQLAKARTRVLKIQLEVFPFVLKDNPDKRYGMFFQAVHGRETDEALNLAGLQHLFDHGGSVLLTNWWAVLRYEYVDDDQVVWDSTRFRRCLDILVKAGYSGPLYVDTHLSDIADKLYGISRSDDPKGLAQAIEANPQPLKEAAYGFLREINRVRACYPQFEKWILTVSDEVTSKRMPIYLTIAAMVKQIAPAYPWGITFHTLRKGADNDIKKLDPVMDVRIHSGGGAFEVWLLRGKSLEAYAKEVEQSGDDLWMYANPWSIHHNAKRQRVINSLFMWMTPFSVRADWRYMVGDNGELLREAEGIAAFGYSYTVASPTHPTRRITSRAFIGWREGIDDIKYLYTLEDAVKHAVLPPQRDLAGRARRWLDDYRQAIPKPVGKPISDTGNIEQAGWTQAMLKAFSEEDLQQRRRAAAEWIRQLIE